MLILGADPGSLRTGYGVLESDGRRHRMVEFGVLSPPPRAPLPQRLLYLHGRMGDLIARVEPDLMAVEDVFHAANSRSALVLGHARGVLLLAGAEANLPIHTYAPATVKAQVTGFGGADKRQVAYMVARLLGLSAASTPPGDAADALAVALCAAQRPAAEARA
jgi:crossover junction endodeoxyribonuclease RuvC